MELDLENVIIKMKEDLREMDLYNSSNSTVHRKYVVGLNGIFISPTTGDKDTNPLHVERFSLLDASRYAKKIVNQDGKRFTPFLLEDAIKDYRERCIAVIDQVDQFSTKH